MSKFHKPKRTKKYNPIKTTAFYVSSIFKGKSLGVLYVGHNQCCNIIDINTLTKLRVTKEMALALFNTPLRWHVVNGVFMRENNGKFKSILEMCVAPHPCLQTQLSVSLGQEHSRMVQEQIDKGLRKNIINIGWLATPYELDLDEHIEFIDKVFTHFNAFDETCIPSERLVKFTADEILSL